MSVARSRDDVVNHISVGGHRDRQQGRYRYEFTKVSADYGEGYRH